MERPSASLKVTSQVAALTTGEAIGIEGPAAQSDCVGGVFCFSRGHQAAKTIDFVRRNAAAIAEAGTLRGNDCNAAPTILQMGLVTPGGGVGCYRGPPGNRFIGGA